MNWAIIAQLIITEGVPVAAAIIERWSNNTPVTPEEFGKIRSIAQQTAADRLKLKLVQAGIPLDSDQAKALLALV